MPSVLPRCLLTLPTDLYKILDEFAEASDKPLATVITDLLGEMAPELVGLTKVHRQLKAGRVAAAKLTLKHTFGDGIASLLAGAQPELFAAPGKGNRVRRPKT